MLEFSLLVSRITGMLLFAYMFMHELTVTVELPTVHMPLESEAKTACLCCATACALILFAQELMLDVVLPLKATTTKLDAEYAFLKVPNGAYELAYDSSE